MVADMVHRNKDKVLAAGKVVDKVDKMVEGRKLMLRRAIHQQFQLERERQKTGRSVSRLLDQ
jgi:hypothetical protein